MMYHGGFFVVVLDGYTAMHTFMHTFAQLGCSQFN